MRISPSCALPLNPQKGGSNRLLYFFVAGNRIRIHFNQIWYVG